MVTIVVMLILAGVTVSVLTGDNGLITKAVEAKEKSKMAEVKEKVELAAIEWTMIKSSNPNANIDEFWNILIKEGIIDDKEDVEIDGTEYTIKTNDGYEITVTISEDGNIEVGNIGKGKKILHKIKIGNISSNTISIETMLKESAKNTVLSYSYKEDKEISFTEPEELQNIDDLNVIFSKLKAGTTYTVKVVVTLENGELETLTKNVTTEEIASGKITASKPTWENNLASINLKTEETGYQIQWQIDKGTGEIDESEWTTAAKGITTANVPNLKHKDTVYTRLWDGISGGKEASVQIEDTGKPDVTVTKESVTSNSITVTVSSQDNEWGMPDVPIYNYYIKEKDGSYESTAYKANSTDKTCTFTGLIHGREYIVKVTTKDKAEVLGDGESEVIETLRVPEAIEGLEEGNIKASVEWKKTTHKATMTLETTTGYQIQWQEDPGTNQIDDDNWNTGSSSVTISDKELNYTIIARLWDGKNGGSYAAAKVSDGKAHDAKIEIPNAVVTPEGKITATVTLNDDESGVDVSKCRWVFTESSSKLGETSSQFTDDKNFNKGFEIEWTPPSISGKTYWLHVLTVDNAGNKLETVSEQSVIVGIIPTGTADGENVIFDTSNGKIDILWLNGESNTITEAPNLPTTSDLSGMTKVTWTKSGTTWKEDSTPVESEWGKYNAGTGTEDNITSQWANVKRDADGSYFVWIPRYAYRITYYDDDNNITGYYDGYGMWSKDGELRVGIDEGVETVFAPNGDKYIVHPAFTDNVDLGGWSKPIRGFWTAKYEMNQEKKSGSNWSSIKPANATAGNVATSSTIRAVSKPNVSSWTYITIGNCYTNAYNYDRTKESHLMKNSEWGAIAYLTHSTYGRNGHEITINSVGHTTGGGSSYNTESGALQSTTGNIYGVYDMSGGAWDFIAGWNVKGDSSKFATGSSFASSTKRSNEYATAYENGTSSESGNKTIFEVGKVGDATKEVNTGGAKKISDTSFNYNWFKDYPNVVCLSTPFFERGKFSGEGAVAGIFALDNVSGSAVDFRSFRVVLTP